MQVAQDHGHEMLIRLLTDYQKAGGLTTETARWLLLGQEGSLDMIGYDWISEKVTRLISNLCTERCDPWMQVHAGCLTELRNGGALPLLHSLILIRSAFDFVAEEGVPAQEKLGESCLDEHSKSALTDAKSQHKM